MSLLIGRSLPLCVIYSFNLKIGNSFEVFLTLKHYWSFCNFIKKLLEITNGIFTNKDDLYHFQVGRWLEIISRVGLEVLIMIT